MTSFAFFFLGFAAGVGISILVACGFILRDAEEYDATLPEPPKPVSLPPLASRRWERR
jgi:hypothetical protein